MKFNILSKIIVTIVLVMVIPISFAGMYLNNLIEEKNNESINERLTYGKNYILNIIKINEVKNKAKSIKIAGDRRLWNHLAHYSDTTVDYQKSQLFSETELFQMMASEDISVLKIYDTQFNELFDISHQFIDQQFQQIDKSFLKQGFSETTTREILMHQGILIYSSSPVREYYKGTVATGKITNILVQGKLIKKSAFENLKEMSDQEICLIEVDSKGKFNNVITTFHDAYGTSLSGQEIVQKDFIESLNSVISHPEKSIIRTISFNDKRYKSIFFPIKTSTSGLYLGSVFQEVNKSAKGVEQYYILILLFIVLGSIIFASILISRSILKPLNRLIHGIDDLSENIEQEGTITKIEINSKDEFHTLSTAFNNMALELHGAYRSLHDNISELRRIEEALVKNEHFLNSVIENIPDMIFVKDAEELRFIRVNKAGEDLLGFNREEMIGKNNYDFYTQKEADFFTQKDREIFDKGMFLDIPEELIQTKKHGERIFHTKKIPIFNKDGKPEYLLGISEDITEKKNIEDLHKAKEAAEIANQAKSEFLANMSHELRTPMHGILSYADFGMQRIDKVSKEKLLEYFSEIADSGNRLMFLLNDLLDLAKLESGKMNYTMTEQDISDSIAAVANSFRPIFEKKKLKLQVNVPGTPLTTIFDTERIHQVLSNLLSNSIKFSKAENEIIIKAQKEITTIENKQQAVITVSVSDQGIGIPQHELQTVFDKFTQSSKTQTGAGGTGLGLAICKQIIEDHGGKIWVENGKEGGALFYFTLLESR